MFLKYIEHMRTQPHAARKRFAFFCALGFTGIILIIWGFTLPSRLSSININTEEIIDSEKAAELNNSLGEGKDSLSTMIEAGKSLSNVTNEQQEGTDEFFMASSTFENEAGVSTSSVQASRTEQFILIATTSSSVDN